MARKKVKLSYITNDSKRRQTFNKRKKGLMKKVEELSILCGIQACVIIYSPYDFEPAVWPSPLGVQHVLAQFNIMPEMEQSKKMMNQESFLRHRLEKGNGQLKKERKDNCEKEMILTMFQSLTGKSLQGLSKVDLRDLGWVIDKNLKEIHSKMSTLKEEAQNKNQVHVAPAGASAGGADHGVLRSIGENSVQEAMEREVAMERQIVMERQAAMERQMAMERQAFELNNMEALQRLPWFMN